MMQSQTKSPYLTETQNIGIAWDFCILLAMTAVMIILPFSAAFEGKYWDVSLFANLLLATLLVADSIQIRKRNLSSEIRSQFIPKPLWEAASMLPLAALLGLHNHGWPALLIGVHLLRFPTLLNRFKSHSKHKILGKGIQVATVLVITAVVMHWLACFYLIVFASHEGTPGTQYNLALYWTITTLTTVGYGDITPTNNLSRVYTMLVMMAGVGFYGLVIGQVSQYIAVRDKRKEEEKQELENLSSFFRHYEIPSNLQSQTVDFYRHLLSRRTMESEQNILAALPKALQKQLQIYMNIKPLSNISIFAGCSTECISEAAQALVQVFFEPGEAIIRKGELGDDMFVIGWGNVRVHDGKQNISRLSEGNCFGEMALILSEKRGADITAESYCDLFRLRKQDFSELVNKHADLKNNVQDIVNARKAA